MSEQTPEIRKKRVKRKDNSHLFKIVIVSMGVMLIMSITLFIKYKRDNQNIIQELNQAQTLLEELNYSTNINKNTNGLNIDKNKNISEEIQKQIALLKEEKQKFNEQKSKYLSTILATNKILEAKLQASKQQAKQLDPNITKYQMKEQINYYKSMSTENKSYYKNVQVDCQNIQKTLNNNDRIKEFYNTLNFGFKLSQNQMKSKIPQLRTKGQEQYKMLYSIYNTTKTCLSQQPNLIPKQQTNTAKQIQQPIYQQNRGYIQEENSHR